MNCDHGLKVVNRELDCGADISIPQTSSLSQFTHRRTHTHTHTNTQSHACYSDLKEPHTKTYAFITSAHQPENFCDFIFWKCSLVKIPCHDLDGIWNKPVALPTRQSVYINMACSSHVYNTSGFITCNDINLLTWCLFSAGKHVNLTEGMFHGHDTWAQTHTEIKPQWP